MDSEKHCIRVTCPANQIMVDSCVYRSFFSHPNHNLSCLLKPILSIRLHGRHSMITGHHLCLVSSHTLSSNTYSTVNSSFHTKGIRGLQDVRRTMRLKEVLIVSLPLRMIDTINPILHLHHQTAILGNCPRQVRGALTSFDRHCAVHAVAAVDLERILVGKDVDLDTRPFG